MIGLLIVAVVSGAVGVILALCRARRFWAIVACCALCSLSTLVTYWDVLIRDPAYWVRNIVDGVLQICLALVLFNALPAVIGYEATRWVLGRRAAAPQRAK